MDKPQVETEEEEDTLDLYDPRYISEFVHQVNSTSKDIGTVIMETIEDDGADHPLPFELITAVSQQLASSKAVELLSAARNLDIWNDLDATVLAFNQVRMLNSSASANWRQHVIPLAHKVWNEAPTGSYWRFNAGLWLSEVNEATDNVLLSIFAEVPPRLTPNGHYLRLLKIWDQNRNRVQTILPHTIDALADAWSVLGIDRLSDRAAIACLLASLQNKVDGKVRLLAEINSILPLLSENERCIVQSVALTIGEPHSAAYRTVSIDWNDPLLDLLRASRSGGALQLAQEIPLPDRQDAHLRRLLLTVEATGHAKSSGEALRRLEDGAQLLDEASPLWTWVYHCMKASLHSARLEYNAALLDLDNSIRQAARLGDHSLLHVSIHKRQNVYYKLDLPEFGAQIEKACSALDLVFASAGLAAQDRRRFSLSRFLGLALPEYHSLLEDTRGAYWLWRQQEQSSAIIDTNWRKEFGERIHRLLDRWKITSPRIKDDPLHLAMLNFAMANLALSARSVWPEAKHLYDAHVSQWLSKAVSTATAIEAYDLLNKSHALLKRYRTHLKPNELPRLVATARAAQLHDLGLVARLLQGAGGVPNRRGLHRITYRRLASLLDSLVGEVVDSVFAKQLLDVLQQLKHPHLEFEDAALEAGSRDTLSWTTDISYENDDQMAVQEWNDLAAVRLRSDNAVCIELIFTDSHLLCLFIDALDNTLDCKLLTLDIPWSNKLKQRFRTWGSSVRHIIEQFAGADAYSAASLVDSLQQQLQRHPDVFPGRLADILNERRPSVIYLSPWLSLNKLPLHMLQNRSGWSLSDSAPVLQVAKTRQLTAVHPQSYLQDACVIVGSPKDDFENHALSITDRLHIPCFSPTTRQELIETLRKYRISVILAHGFIDVYNVTRSRVSFSGGLRLTLRDIKDLELTGNEVVLLSCWAGWSARAGSPLGELTGGPSSWLSGGAGAVLAPIGPVPIDAGCHYILDYVSSRLTGETRASAIRRANVNALSYEYGVLCRSVFVLHGVNA